ncbi:hypothetical protein ACGC1H_007627 [Rhizoctonia solani]|uniref:Uncharacterized protein n=1 Tax=Rhizoctonia solani TaxID=456999 RepID=A0A8H3H2P4_9AGAM|nr:unnamed protein product [Rhizoctonia solani]
MSGSHTPESVLSVSSSSSSSGRRLDSNTTPSPSGGNRSPKLNTRVLSNKLAMLEASQALAQAASTLSIAAQAMSKAAASLAAVGDYSDEDHSYEAGYSGDAEDWVRSPDWTQSSYNLSYIPDTSSGRELGTTDEGYKLGHVDRTVPVEGVIELQQECLSAPEQEVNKHASNSALLPEKPPPAPQAAATQASSEAFSSQLTSDIPSNPARSVVDPIPVPVNDETGLLPEGNVTKGSKPGARAKEKISTAPVSIPAVIIKTPRVSATDYAGPSGSSASSTQPTGPTHIILERGFDSFPAVCYLAERCAKTICIYNYPGTISSTTNIEAILKKNTKLPVIMPESSKQERLVEATRKFNLAPSSILVWPGYKKLLKITDLADSPDIQLIHIGEPNQINANTVGLKTTFILAKSNLGQPHGGVPRNRLPDASNDICNQQGPGSPLEPYRIWLRSRFSQNTCVRGIYWDWIVQCRKQDPKRGVVEIVRLANRFAEEFLLRGTSKEYGGPVGGQVTVSGANIKGHNMEPAIHAGLLLVV